MTHPCQRAGLNRRNFLAGAGASLTGVSFSGLVGLDATARRALAENEPAAGGGIPGPFPGRVVEVSHPGMIRDGIKNHDAVREAMRRGMMELTGTNAAEEAWRTFFEPGDVVGIKVNPVGHPLANSSTEVILETIAGLRSAGVQAKDIIVFERYLDALLEAGFDRNLPEGVRFDALTRVPDRSQLNIDGYDPDEYMSLELVHPEHDPQDDRTRRSHLGLLVTRQVNKIVCLPVLKDHRSAGVTLALKNMSHGLVNNVARSHGSAQHNVCNQFIPQVVNHPVIRKKVVLQILDGIKGVFQGGPFAKRPEWTWERNSLFFATDPVALDHVGWEIVDARRVEAGLGPVGAAGKLGLGGADEDFDMRQPQHIALAGALGLGVFEKAKIDHRVIHAA